MTQVANSPFDRLRFRSEEEKKKPKSAFDRLRFRADKPQEPDELEIEGVQVPDIGSRFSTAHGGRFVDDYTVPQPELREQFKPQRPPQQQLGAWGHFATRAKQAFDWSPTRIAKGLEREQRAAIEAEANNLHRMIMERREPEDMDPFLRKLILDWGMEVYRGENIRERPMRGEQASKEMPGLIPSAKRFVMDSPTQARLFEEIGRRTGIVPSGTETRPFIPLTSPESAEHRMKAQVTESVLPEPPPDPQGLGQQAAAAAGDLFPFLAQFGATKLVAAKGAQLNQALRARMARPMNALRPRPGAGVRPTPIRNLDQLQVTPAIREGLLGGLYGLGRHGTEEGALEEAALFHAFGLAGALASPYTEAIRRMSPALRKAAGLAIPEEVGRTVTKTAGPLQKAVSAGAMAAAGGVQPATQALMHPSEGEAAGMGRAPGVFDVLTGAAVPFLLKGQGRALHFGRRQLARGTEYLRGLELRAGAEGYRPTIRGELQPPSVLRHTRPGEQRPSMAYARPGTDRLARAVAAQLEARTGKGIAPQRPTPFWGEGEGEKERFEQQAIAREADAMRFVGERGFMDPARRPVPTGERQFGPQPRQPVKRATRDELNLRWQNAAGVTVKQLRDAFWARQRKKNAAAQARLDEFDRRIADYFRRFGIVPRIPELEVPVTRGAEAPMTKLSQQAEPGREITVWKPRSAWTEAQGREAPPRPGTPQGPRAPTTRPPAPTSPAEAALGPKAGAENAARKARGGTGPRYFPEGTEIGETGVLPWPEDVAVQRKGQGLVLLSESDFEAAKGRGLSDRDIFDAVQGGKNLAKLGPTQPEKPAAKELPKVEYTGTGVKIGDKEVSLDAFGDLMKAGWKRSQVQEFVRDNDRFPVRDTDKPPGAVEQPPESLRAGAEELKRQQAAAVEAIIRHDEVSREIARRMKEGATEEDLRDLLVEEAKLMRQIAGAAEGEGITPEAGAPTTPSVEPAGAPATAPKPKKKPKGPPKTKPEELATVYPDTAGIVERIERQVKAGKLKHPKKKLSIVRDFMDWLTRDKGLEAKDITQEVLDQYYDHVTVDRATGEADLDAKKRTAGSNWSVIKQFVEELGGAKIIKPFKPYEVTRYATEPEEASRALTGEERTRAFTVAKQEHARIFDSPADKEPRQAQDLAIWEVLSSSFGRKGELLSYTWDRLTRDDAGRYGIDPEVKSRTKGETRQIGLSMAASKALDALKKWRNPQPTDPIFLDSARKKQISKNAINAAVERVGKLFGASEKLRPHDIRRTMATLIWERSGGDIRRVMEYTGHKSESAAWKYINKYVQRAEAQKRAAELDEMIAEEIGGTAAAPPETTVTKPGGKRESPEPGNFEVGDMVAGPIGGGGEGSTNRPRLRSEPTELHPLPPHYLFRLARAALKSPPVLRNIARGVLGRLTTTGRMLISPEAAKDPEILARTLGHEIGHAPDYLAGLKRKARGLVKRVMLMTGWAKEVAERGSPALERAMKAELLRLSYHWRPRPADYDHWSTKKRNAYDKYRNADSELFADAISVLLNSPPTLERMAPTFFQEFFRGIDEAGGGKITQAYLRLQRLLGSGEQAIALDRYQYAGRHMLNAESIMRNHVLATQQLKTSLINSIMFTFLDRGYPVALIQKHAERAGSKILDNENARWIVDELSMKDGPNVVLYQNIEKDVVDPMRQRGYDTLDIGLYGFFRRIAEGGRTFLEKIGGEESDNNTGEGYAITRELGNPWAITQAEAKHQMKMIRNRWGEKDFAFLEERMKIFDDAVFEVVKKARDVGIVKDHMWDKVQENKGNYMTFLVVDKVVGDMVRAGIYGSEGTFKDIVNPFHATLLKMGQLNRMIAWVEAKNAFIKMADKVHKDEIKHIRGLDQDIFRERPYNPKAPIPQAAAGRGIITTFMDGKVKHFDVPDWIAATFKNPSMEAHRFARALSYLVYKPFHPLFVTLNMSWQARNLVRDYLRTARNLRAIAAKFGHKLTWGDVSRAYLWALGPKMTGYNPARLPRTSDGNIDWGRMKDLKNWPIASAAFGAVAGAAIGGLPGAAVGALTGGAARKGQQNLFEFQGPAAARARNWRHRTIQDMLNAKALEIPFTHHEFGPEDTSYTRQLRRLGHWTGEPSSKMVKAFRTIFSDRVAEASLLTESLPKVAAWKLFMDMGLHARRAAYYVRNYVGTPNFKRRGEVTEFTNQIWMYSNVVMQGWISDAAILFGKEGKKPALAAWKYMITREYIPKIIQRAAELGLLSMFWPYGREPEEFFKKIHPDHLARYIIVPLGWAYDEEQDKYKPRYFRIPHSDTGRILAQFVYSLSKGDIENAIRNMDGELPQFSPPLKIAYKFHQGMTGGSPQDWRGNDIITTDTKASGRYVDRFYDVFRWSLSQGGVLSSIGHQVVGKPGHPGHETEEERIYYSIPGLAGVLVVSDDGYDSNVYREMHIKNQEGARLRILAKHDKFLGVLPVENKIKAMLRRRWFLNQAVPESLDRTDQMQKYIMREWYRDYGWHMEQAAEADERGDKARVKEIIGHLREVTEEYSGVLKKRKRWEPIARSFQVLDHFDATIHNARKKHKNRQALSFKESRLLRNYERYGPRVRRWLKRVEMKDLTLEKKYRNALDALRSVRKVMGTHYPKEWEDITPEMVERAE